MARSTIDFGIDLGTTNSEIACMDRGELEVIKNAVTNNEVTPSAVKIDGRGRFVVGQSAYNDLEYDRDNVASEFKRWMGNPQHDTFTFRKSCKTLRAAELSAEVLKVLKASASARFGGEEIKAAVITVPAMFLIPACEDTKAAAKLAGIDICPLLQEPVAAAMAYGYEAEKLSGNLLVFDLGGGTFDTTVLTAKEGRLIVVGHSGDDKLGGKEYDWALVEIIASKLRKEYGEQGLSRREPKALAAFARLKYLAEDAKKNLSMTPVCPVEVTYLIGTGPYSQGVYSVMVDEVVLGRLATPLEQPLDKPVDIFCHDVPCLMPREVSRYHAMIYRVGDASKTSIVKDLGSTCGTYVNGVRLGTAEGSDEPAAKLSSGDVISLGPSHVNSYLFVELR